MSNLDPAPEAMMLTPGIPRAGGSGGVVPPGIHRAVDVLEARKAAVGDGTEVRRLLPQRTLRTVGAWCFLDHYGPDEVSIGPGMQVPVRQDFEYGVVAADGPGVVAGALIGPGLLAHLPAGLSEIRFSPAGRRRQARFFVVGGVPFGERLLMWWNFVACDGEEIAQAREDWAVQGSGRFGEVRGYPGRPLTAPPLPSVPLKPR